MPYERDVRAFDERAASYESGRLGQFHRDLADRAVRVALTVAPAPERVLDVGSGTGYALRQLAAAAPGAQELTGVDAAAGMVRVLTPGGHLVLSDLFSVWLGPTLVGSRRGRARTRGRASRLIAAAGLRDPRWHRLACPIVATVTATR